MSTITTETKQATEHLENLSICQLRQLLIEQFNREQLVSVIASVVPLSAVLSVVPSLRVVKQRVYEALGVADTAAVRAIALEKGWIELGADFRRKDTWLRIEQCLGAEVVESGDRFDQMNTRQLRALAKEVKLPGWGKIVKAGGTEGLRVALREFLA